MKKILSVLLALALLFSCVSLAAADETLSLEKKVVPESGLNGAQSQEVKTISFGKGELPLGEDGATSGLSQTLNQTIYYKDSISPPSGLKASTVNHWVYLQWNQVSTADWYGIYEYSNGKWNYLDLSLSVICNIVAKTAGTHRYGISTVWNMGGGTYYESSKVVYIDVVVSMNSDTPQSGDTYYDLSLTGYTDKTYNINVERGAFLHIKTDGLTWISNTGATITPLSFDGIYFLSLGNDVWIRPEKYEQSGKATLLVGTYSYTTTTYEGTTCYKVGNKKAYHTLKITFVNPSPTPAQKVQNFVTRCYQLILGRNPDTAGLNSWTNALINGTATASQIINGFVNSNEFLSKKYSNSAAVTILYRTMLGRNPDSSGLAAWTSVLNQGYPFGVVINGFCGSAEFIALCNEYGITPGRVDVGDDDPNTRMGRIRRFVSRCYEIILGRAADATGLAAWAEALANGSAAASQIIDGFVNSNEFLSKHYSHAAAVIILYRAMLGRDPDAQGLAAWTQVLDMGYPFGTVINGFCGSVEFVTMCNEYGIIPGSVVVNYLSGEEEEEFYEEPDDLSQAIEEEPAEIIEE